MARPYLASDILCGRGSSAPRGESELDELRRLLLSAPKEQLLAQAATLRDVGHGTLVSFSPKVFIPLTRLCRDVCHYCTFAKPPIEGRRAYLSLDEVLGIARAGAAAGCR